MNNIKKTVLLIFASFTLILNVKAQNKPNILWIVTDDHRADAIESYNKILTGNKNSALGYVSSPNIDKLASEGAFFINAYNNSPACGPSRGSMVSGRYTFRNAHYAFEQTHQEPDFVKPTFTQTLQKKGYVTASFGKDGAYIFKWGPGQGFKDAGLYDYKVSFKHDLQKNDVGDFWNQPAYKKGTWKSLGTEERVKTPDGKIVNFLIKKKDGEFSKEDIKTRDEVEKKYEILRSYTRYNKDLIIGGENPMPAGETIDAKVVEEMKLYLENQNKAFKTTWGEDRTGVNPEKPLMINLGFHLPHTPVLPPKEFRDKFKKKKYKVPAFTEKELENMPPQIHQLYKNLNFSKMSTKDKQQAIQDYYAFCAYGDALIGESVEIFKEYCKKNNQEYFIIFTVGDHGWHLGEQGIEAKFGPWDKSTNGAMIMVSSDKTKVPEGLVQKQLVEYVDIAPTILSEAGEDIHSNEYDYLDGFNMMDFVDNNEEKREYIVGEINLVAGARAYIRSRDFAFSMKTRTWAKKREPNQGIKWALTCPVEEAELVLYDLRKDPDERENVGDKKEYKALASWFRNKLGNIVLGDGRIECDWSKANTYNVSNFAKGAHNGKLDIPRAIIPKIK